MILDWKKYTLSRKWVTRNLCYRNREAARNMIRTISGIVPCNVLLGQLMIAMHPQVKVSLIYKRIRRVDIFSATMIVQLKVSNIIPGVITTILQTILQHEGICQTTSTGLKTRVTKFGDPSLHTIRWCNKCPSTNNHFVRLITTIVSSIQATSSLPL